MTTIADIIETITETIEALKAIVPAEELPEALQMSMKALEMDKGLDPEVKALAFSAYLQALVDAVAPSNAEVDDTQQRMQRKHHEESIDNSCAAHERALSYYSLAKLKELAMEQGLDIKARSKAVYINALVGKYRLALLNA